jgi:hypothetical protein
VQCAAQSNIWAARSTGGYPLLIGALLTAVGVVLLLSSDKQPATPYVSNHTFRK